jgi:hypothetical protein
MVVLVLKSSLPKAYGAANTDTVATGARTGLNSLFPEISNRGCGGADQAEPGKFRAKP